MIFTYFCEYPQAICRFGMYRLRDQFFHFDFSIFSIPHLSVDSACVLGSPMFARFSSGIFSPNFRFSLSLTLSLSLSLSPPSPSHRFSGRNILKKLVYHGGALSIYIYIYKPQFTCKSFELVCRAARTGQEAGTSWFSPTWCFSTVNIPKLFADSA